MSITRLGYKSEIPGVKFKADSKSEADGFIKQMDEGDIIEVNGELYFKDQQADTTVTGIGSLEVSGTLTTTQVKNLNGTPITLIAAPGAGKVIIIDEIQLFLDYAAATYVAAAGEDLSFKYTGAATISTIDSDGGFITSTADAHLIAKPSVYDVDNATTANGFVFTAVANKGVDITVLSGELATGDSPLLYKIKYRIVDVLS